MSAVDLRLAPACHEISGFIWNGHHTKKRRTESTAIRETLHK